MSSVRLGGALRGSGPVLGTGVGTLVAGSFAGRGLRVSTAGSWPVLVVASACWGGTVRAVASATTRSVLRRLRGGVPGAFHRIW